MYLDEHGQWRLMPNSGPRHGFSVSSDPPFFVPNAGPKHGLGSFPGMSSSGGSADDRRCLELVNDFRKRNGKSPLAYSQVLSDIAMTHSQGMLSGKVPFGHAGFPERAARVPQALGTGENVAYCSGVSDSVRTMVDGWIESPGHRRNLLGNFNAMGIAFAVRGDLWYGTQFFGHMGR
jgi:uncharacterized protein YkwD